MCNKMTQLTFYESGHFDCVTTLEEFVTLR